MTVLSINYRPIFCDKLVWCMRGRVSGRINIATSQNIKSQRKIKITCIIQMKL